MELRRAMRERVPITHVHYYPPLGEWIENRSYPGPEGGLSMFVSYVTERKRAEEKLHQAQTELAHVTRMTTMGELAASIAHEINQPLGAIVNNGNACNRILSEKGCPAEARECLNDIVKDAIRASSIIVRIRALMKRTPPEKTQLFLRDVVTDVLALAHAELTRHEIVVHTTFEPELCIVSGDRVQLQQVMLNLLINGIEAMRDVVESDRMMSIREVRETREDQPFVLLSVKDSGRGLNPGNMDRLFEAFYTTKPQGMGMGLRISRSIIEAHGGRLWGTPNVGPGATFQFILPLEQKAGPDQEI
jgi:C4-dicarboxylate-specific signal transduction histidine kinase